MARTVSWSPIPPVTGNLAAVPTTPGLRNPANIPQEDFLTGRLDPNSATWVGGGARAAIRAGSQQLEAGLRGYGRFSFGTEDQYGQREVSDQGGNPGELYRRQALAARAAANAGGMLYSRTADMAVGEAWARLDDQKRALFNQHASLVSSQLNQIAADTMNISSNLAQLYGDDARYALENIPAAPAAGAASPAAPGGATAPAAPRSPMGGPDRPTPPGGPDMPRGVVWTGQAPPNWDKLRAAHPGKRLTVQREGGRYVVRVTGSY